MRRMTDIFWRVVYLIWLQVGPDASEDVYLARQYKRRSWSRKDPKIRAAFQKHRNHPLVRGYLPYQWDLSAY